MYGNLNWKDIEELKQKENFVLLLPIGSTESHGPHCPVATDTIIAVETCLRAAQKLHEKGYKAYVFTDYISLDMLVKLRDSVERNVRDRLNIPFNPGAPGIRFEHSMGMSGPLPSNILKTSQL